MQLMRVCARMCVRARTRRQLNLRRARAECSIRWKVTVLLWKLRPAASRVGSQSGRISDRSAWPETRSFWFLSTQGDFLFFLFFFCFESNTGGRQRVQRGKVLFYTEVMEDKKGLFIIFVQQGQSKSNVNLNSSITVSICGEHQVQQVS